MTTRQDRPGTNSRASEANAWAARHMMEEELSLVEIAQWKDWISDLDNSAEYDEVMMFIERMRRRPMRTVSGDDGVSRPPVDAVGVECAGVEPRYLPRATNPFRLVAVAAAVVVVSCLGYVFLWDHHPGLLVNAEQSYVTAPGQHRTVTLADGSMITLGGRTVIETRFSSQERLVFVEQGEALFQVEHDPRRIFRVMAQGGSITALGTEFDVRCYARRVLVTVTRGAVEVGPRAAGAGAAASNGTLDSSIGWVPVRVSSNQRMTYSINGNASAAQPTDASGAIAWIDGELRYRRQPLREVIEDVQRISQREFEVEPAVAELPYTGTIRQGSLDQWLRDLERIFPVKVIPREQGPTLIALREPPVEGKSK